MSFNDQLFDAFLIVLYLATPLAWAGAMFVQDKSGPIRSFRSESTRANKSAISSTPSHPASKF